MPIADLPPAVQAFQRAANAMYAAAAVMPTAVAYDVRAHVHAGGDADYRYHYEVGGARGSAALRVDAGDDPPPGPPWPLDPRFDAFARFSTSGAWHDGGHDRGRFVNDPQPLVYDSTKRPGADAQAIAVKNYVIRYAPSPLVVTPYVRLELTALPDAERTQTVFTSLVIDTTTWLPAQITLRTPVGRSSVTLDYATVAGHPVVVRYRIAGGFDHTEAWFENIRFAAAGDAARETR